MSWRNGVSTGLDGASFAWFGYFLTKLKLHTEIVLLLKVLQISQRVGALPGSGGLRGTIKVLAAAAGWDWRPSLGFSQPEQVEALKGGLDEETFWKLCALIFAVLLKSLCRKSHGQCWVIWRLVSC